MKIDEGRVVYLTLELKALLVPKFRRKIGRITTLENAHNVAYYQGL